VHVLLLGALGWGVSWRQQADRTLTVEAELWSAIPQQAAPRLQAPAPPPTAARATTRARPARAPAAPAAARGHRRSARRRHRALERQKKEAETQGRPTQGWNRSRGGARSWRPRRKKRFQREREQRSAWPQEKAEQERQKKTVDERAANEKEAARTKEEAARAERELKAQREANLRRIAGLAGATGAESSKGSAERSSGPSASYAGKVAARVKPNIVFTDDIAGNPMADVEVRAAPDGTIQSTRLLKSSGIKAWDEAVLKAIVKTEKLPLDTDGRAPSTLIIGFRPKD
jgi:colicin import membrane protein